ncbi:hypothetical protein HQN90_17705 [Paenibacillus alba]|uniref:hypothetical protein n=1 Tax=Paenibacillus alba TaxID=1197127 RepID=UPI001563121C|nr:hypothetical protein [Paenibacillus alba]NQX67960.1 hypothetical protein [Paenibacillus alba]
MQDTNLRPSLDSLFDQYEDIGGPETFGPNGTAIILAIWRKSKRLGWIQTFHLTNTELHYQTGIKSRGTINLYREMLAEAGIIKYVAPPRGQSRGEYSINFAINKMEKVVQNMNNFVDNYTEVVQEMDNLPSVLGEVVQNTDNFNDTVLRDTITTIKTVPNPFEFLFEEYCKLHNKLDIHVKTPDVSLMQSMVSQNISVFLMVNTMKALHKERTAKGTKISGFAYYKEAILEAWESFKAITDGVPAPVVALGGESITDGAPISTVALGSSSKRTKQQQELDDLRRRAEEERQREKVRSV